MGNADNRIDLAPNMNVIEGAAGEAMTPGHLVIRNAAGTFDLRDIADITAPVAVCCDAPERGKSIDDAYVVGETVRVCYPNPGELVNVRLAAAQTVAIGDALEAGDNGVVVEGTGITLFIAEEAVTSGGATALCRVRGAGQQIA